MKRRAFNTLRFVENRFSLLLSVYAVSFLLCFLLSVWLPGEGETLPLLLLALPLVSLYFPLLFFLRSEEGRRAPFGLSRVNKAFFTETLLFAFAALCLGAGGILFYRYLSLPFVFYGSVTLPETFSLLFFIAFVPVTAFCEEMLVRGVLQTHFTTFGSWPAVLASALLSAALCLSVTALPLYLLAGGLCAIVRDRTSSVLPALLCAALWRFGAYLASASLFGAVLTARAPLLVSVLLLFVAALLLLGAMLSRKGKKRHHVAISKENGRTRWLILAWALCALLLCFGAGILLPTMN